MNPNDTLQRFIFEQAPIRGEIVRLNATWQAVLERRDYPLAVRTLLGETMAAAALLAATIKFKGSFIMQVQGNGPVSLLVVECTSDNTLRAVAHWDDDVQPGPLVDMLGDGRLVITVNPSEGTERYQGIVALEGDSIAAALENYLTRSEQLDTRLWLTADDGQATGMLLQRLPGTTGEDEDAWPRAVHLGTTLTRDELLALPAAEIVHRLYHEEDIRLFEGEPLSFRCSCSRERVTMMLRVLGSEEIHGILNEQGVIKVDCEFCGQHYELDSIDAELLFTAPVPAEMASTHH